MVGLVPALKLIIGEPPLVTELESQQVQRCFQLAFQRFIGDHAPRFVTFSTQWRNNSSG
ncbi:MAG: hypothetical protein LBV73_05905 [Paraburkholderia sp.]|jgi:predicted ATPase|nr:hypothetical protein [Paraburkholderia sp.]